MLVTALAACASSDEGPSLAGISGGKALVDLSSDELDQVCSSIDDRVLNDSQAVHGLCRTRGAFIALHMLRDGLQGDGVDVCMSSEQECLTMTEYDYCVGPISDHCDHSVGDLSHCVDETVEHLELSANRTCQEAIVALSGPRLAQECDEITSCFNIDAAHFAGGP
jgi:hypothetical protein